MSIIHWSITIQRNKPMRSIPQPAPEGLSNAGRDAKRFAGIVGDYASDTVARLVRGAHSGSKSSSPTFAGSTQADNAARTADDHYDEGLVHNHNWAMTSR
jgi:hypothetical protein